jgi:hypothetical protein
LYRIYSYLTSSFGFVTVPRPVGVLEEHEGRIVGNGSTRRLVYDATGVFGAHIDVGTQVRCELVCIARRKPTDDSFGVLANVVDLEPNVRAGTEDVVNALEPRGDVHGNVDHYGEHEVDLGCSLAMSMLRSTLSQQRVEFLISTTCIASAASRPLSESGGCPEHVLGDEAV